MNSWKVVAFIGLVWTLSGASALAQHDVSATTTKEKTNTTDGPDGVVMTRLAYNSDIGGVLGAGIKTSSLLGEGRSLFAYGEVSRESRRFEVNYSDEKLAGTVPQLGMSLHGQSTDPSRAYAFRSESLRLTFSADLKPGGPDGTRLYALQTAERVSFDSNTVSAVLRKDDGTRHRSGLGVLWRSPDLISATDQSLRMRFSVEVGGTSHGSRYTKVEAGMSARATAAGGRIGAMIQLRSGSISSVDGDTSIGDRYMLGQSSVRGFAFGGLGPRDLSVSGSPALGGNHFAVAQVDVVFPTALGDGARWVPGVFLDAGSLWGLNNTLGGLGGTNLVDDGFHLRSSAGLTVRYALGEGAIQVTVATPLQSRTYDETETVQVSLTRQF